MRFSPIVATGLVLAAANAMARPTFDMQSLIPRAGSSKKGNQGSSSKKKGSQGSSGGSGSGGSGHNSKKSSKSTSVDQKIANMPPELRNKIGQTAANMKHQEKVEAAAKKYHFAPNSKHADIMKDINGQKEFPNHWEDWGSNAYQRNFFELQKFYVATDEREPYVLSEIRRADLLTRGDEQAFGWPLLLTDVRGVVPLGILAHAALFYGRAMSAVTDGVVALRATRDCNPRTVWLE
ncbi:hypothetical protein FISHEDRAFT_62377 [Fistulina hepatica ATCC 64428]|nr:hypothetical protein FISHEDRAFT_62377 [Fistulina hepatica ATCC 64428]